MVLGPRHPLLGVTDSDRFVPPIFGGAIGVKVASFDYADTTAKTLFTLPAGAVPIDWWLDITTDFDAGTTNTLDLGAAADEDYFANDVDIGTQALLRAGVTGSVVDRLGTRFTTDTAITAKYAQSGTAATAGEANVFMLYMMATEDYAVD